MMTVATNQELIDRMALGRARAELGANFVRILGYFREDGAKSVSAIEQAMREQNAAAMVLPAHTLKGESRQFGGELLADIAECIETIARDCIEAHDTPIEAIAHVARLRPVFDATLSVLDHDSNPLAVRRPAGFGRRAAAG